MLAFLTRPMGWPITGERKKFGGTDPEPFAGNVQQGLVRAGYRQATSPSRLLTGYWASSTGPPVKPVPAQSEAAWLSVSEPATQAGTPDPRSALPVIAFHW